MSDPFNVGGNLSQPVTISRVQNDKGQDLYRTSNGKTFTLEELEFYISARMMHSSEAQLKTKSDGLKAKIAEQSKANDVLQALLAHKPTDSATKNLPDDVKTWLTANGETPDSGKINKDKWDEWIEVTRSKIDTLSTNNETDNVEINQLTKMHSEYAELSSNQSSLMARTIEKIINDMT